MVVFQIRQQSQTETGHTIPLLSWSHGCSTLPYSVWKRTEPITGLVNATTNRTGIVCHNTNDGDGFYLSQFLHPHLLNSTRFLTAVKVSRLTDYERKFHEEFHTRIGEVPIEGHTCRTWLLDALFEVSDQGLIDLQPKKAQLSQIETEALGYAIRAAGRGGGGGHSRYEFLLRNQNHGSLAQANILLLSICYSGSHNEAERVIK
ncbi:hypothetical protein H106_06342 [Trichophyton rubrum CBS 735.88]|nr:hypothetical protein H106_06342 [Trichophyton rubrum CBS 735.88]